MLPHVDLLNKINVRTGVRLDPKGLRIARLVRKDTRSLGGNTSMLAEGSFHPLQQRSSERSLTCNREKNNIELALAG